MAILYRNDSTGEVFIENFVNDRLMRYPVGPEGIRYLQQHQVEEGGEVPEPVLSVLREQGWLAGVTGSGSGADPGVDSVSNTSETGALLGDERAVFEEPLPSVKLEPRPFGEPEGVATLYEQKGADMANNERPETQSGYAADKANANPVSHPEAAAFVGSVWFWVLVVIVVAIVVWGAIEIF